MIFSGFSTDAGVAAAFSNLWNYGGWFQMERWALSYPSKWLYLHSPALNL